MTGQGTAATSLGELIIRRALPDDVEALAAIGESTSAWLDSLGIDAGRPPKPLREIAADRVRQGGIYLATLAGVPAGTVTLLCDREALWSDLPGEACHVHGLMVHRDFAGRQIGLGMLRWAEQDEVRGRHTRARAAAIRVAPRGSDDPRPYAERGVWTRFFCCSWIVRPAR